MVTVVAEADLAAEAEEDVKREVLFKENIP